MPTEAPIITTIIPTYRRPLLLRRAIRSVLAQTYPHLRVCVYDNASGDETAAVVAELARDDARLHYHCHAENIGPTANFAYGIEHVDTPFFSFLPDDDYYLPTFYETAMAGFAAHPDAACSAAGTLYVTETGGIFRRSSAEGFYVPPEGLTEDIAGKYPGIMSFVFRKEVIAFLGTMPTVFHWDIEFLWRPLLAFPHVVSNHPGVIVVYHQEQGTRQVDLHAKVESHQAMQGYLEDSALSPPTRTMVEDHLSAHFGNSVFLQGLQSVTDRDFAQAREAAAILRAHFRMARAARIVALCVAVGTRSRLFSRALDLSMDALQGVMIRLSIWRHRALQKRFHSYLPANFER